MADIFISYAREDIEAAKRLATELEVCGWSVFWDRRTPAGRRFAEFIAEKLNAAKCVITLWSKAANGSDWVQEEAEEAKKRNILVPALIEKVDPPWGFRRIQAADLVQWHGEAVHEGFQQLLNDIAQYVPAHVAKIAPEARSEPETEHLTRDNPPEAERLADTQVEARRKAEEKSEIQQRTGETVEQVSEKADRNTRRYWIAATVATVILTITIVLSRHTGPQPPTPKGAIVSPPAQATVTETLAEALKQHSFEFRWTMSTYQSVDERAPAFSPMEVQSIQDNFVIIKYSGQVPGEIRASLKGLELSGTWKEGNGAKGELWIKFDEAYSHGVGWWNYGGQTQEYNASMVRVE